MHDIKMITKNDKNRKEKKKYNSNYLQHTLKKISLIGHVQGVDENGKKHGMTMSHDDSLQRSHSPMNSNLQ